MPESTVARENLLGPYEELLLFCVTPESGFLNDVPVYIKNVHSMKTLLGTSLNLFIHTII